MEIISGFLGYLVPFLLILTVLVFVHEMGHFLVARWYGVRVEVFSVGFGREIFGYTDRAQTRWKFSLIPLGGYVKFFGDANAASQPGEEVAGLTPEERRVAFPCQRLSARAWIVAAGPAANFLLAIVLLTGLFATAGEPFTPPVVGTVVAESAAEQAGLQPEDRIVAINGDGIERFEDVQRIVRTRAGEELAIEVLRAGERLELLAVPQIHEQVDNFGNTHVIGLLGVTRSRVEYVQHAVTYALWRATIETWNLTVGTLEAVGQIIVGARDAKELGGPIGIGMMSGTVAKSGMVAVIWFMAVLSINLGLINLFPIPMLDGGHLMFYGIEALRGRPLGERAQEYGFRIGLALVLSLMLFVTFNDLAKLQVFDFLIGLGT